MTFDKVAERVLTLTGYKNSAFCGDINGEMITAANTIGGELKDYKAVKTFSDETGLDGTAADALVYGICMMLTLINSDTEKNRVFAEIYNAKRAAAKCENVKIKNTLSDTLRGDGL